MIYPLLERSAVSRCGKKTLHHPINLIIMKKRKQKLMKKGFFLLVGISCLLACTPKQESPLYTIGIFQANEAITMDQVREAFIRSLQDRNKIHDSNIRIIARNARGDIPEVQKTAQDFVSLNVDMIFAISTPCLQAALHATRDIPIIFASVANPLLAGVGQSDTEHARHVTGVSSRSPIRKSLALIKEVLPEARRIGTLWTPSELNSTFYLDWVRETAQELGFEIVSVPITNSSEVLLSAHVLISRQIDAIYQISDNTINQSFEALGQVAEENAVPLFGGFLLSTRMGACAALGWDFFEMGYKAGDIALDVMNGKSPGAIPIQYMSTAKLYLNLDAARKQSVRFSEKILLAADEIMAEDTPISREAGGN